MDKYWEHCFQEMMAGNTVLFLGAGASAACVNKSGKGLKMGGDLSKLLAQEMKIDVNNDDTLSDIYHVAVKKNEAKLIEILEREYKGCSPSSEYVALRSFPWRRIYTTNIDDAFEATSRSTAVPSQKIDVVRRNDNLSYDEDYDSVKYVKLNGDICLPAEGFIFSGEEYARASAKPPAWYEEAGRDFSRHTFIFVGTKLNESVLNHMIQLYISKVGERKKPAYLVCPGVSGAKRASLEESNIHVLCEKLEDFVSALLQKFSSGLSGRDVYLKKNPWLAIGDIEKYNKKAISEIIPVDRAHIPFLERPDQHENFYRGYKPSWPDIVRGVPGRLAILKSLEDCISKSKDKVVVLVGQSGSGKTTALMQAALDLSERERVYYLNYSSDLKEVCRFLNDIEKNGCYLFLDRISPYVKEIRDLISHGLGGVKIISAERSNIWKDRVKEHFTDEEAQVLEVGRMSNDDAKEILRKLKRFGNLSRFKGVADAVVIKEICNRFDRQLLIALLEVTYGDGYEKTIRNEYLQLSPVYRKDFVTTVAIATANGARANTETLDIALEELGCHSSSERVADELYGIVVSDGKYLSLRHTVYAEKILGSVVGKKDLFRCMSAYLGAFSRFKQPVVNNIEKSEQQIFKALVNARYVYTLLRGDGGLIRDYYGAMEKRFENDGLFWLQYGLVLRLLNDHHGAYEKLKIARDVWVASAQIAHAFAQQGMIMVMKGFSINPISDIQEAVASLRALESMEKIVNVYPLVTLAETHVPAVCKVSGVDVAVDLAASYANEIERKIRANPLHERLRECHALLTSFYVKKDPSIFDDSSLNRLLGLRG